MNAKIGSEVDTQAFKEAINSCNEINMRDHYKPAADVAVDSIIELENAAGQTDNEDRLQKIDLWLKRWRVVATALDNQKTIIEMVIREFTRIDQSFWSVALYGEKLISENEGLRKQNACLVRGWRSERNFWRGKNRRVLNKAA